MAPGVYLLCMLTSALCAALLWREYRRSRGHLLFWSALSFIGWAVNNALVFVDLVLLPISIDLALVRASFAVASVSLLLYGLIWDEA